MRVFAGLVLVAALTGAAAPQPVKKPQGERKICRAFEQTGTRLGRTRICKTAEEWRVEDEITRKQLEDEQRQVTRY